MEKGKNSQAFQGSGLSYYYQKSGTKEKALKDFCRRAGDRR